MLTINRHCHRHHANFPLNLHPPSSSTSDVGHPPPPLPAETHTSPPPQPHPHPAKPNAKLLYFLLQALIMTLILSLFFVFVGVAVIIFLHLCLVGGALHRRHRRRYRSRPHNNQFLPDCDQSSPGFSPAQLRTLPRMKFRAKSESVQRSNELCAICLENFIEGDWCRELPDCKHVFHANCVDRWLAKTPGCPVCRTTVRVSRKDMGAREMADCGGQLWYAFG